MSVDKDTTCREESQKARQAAWTKADRAKHPEKYKARSRAYREANKERVAARTMAWREANKEHNAARRKAHREANKEAYLARERASRKTNREARLAAGKRYREANKERVNAGNRVRREANKGRKYGLTKAEWLDMITACNGRCPCCKVPFSKILGERPCVDHDHTLGHCREAVRGIICTRCNFVLGHAGDDPKVLRACARHLERVK